MKFTVAFTHPEGARKGLDLIRALERSLVAAGCKCVDHGTCFKPRTVNRRRVDQYLESDVTAERVGRIPIAAVKKVLFPLGVDRFRIKIRHRKEK